MNRQALFDYLEEVLPVIFDEPALGPEWDVSAWLNPDFAAEDIMHIKTLQDAPKLMVAGSLSMKRTAHVLICALLAYYKEGVQWNLAASDIRIAYEADAPFGIRLHISHAVAYKETMDSKAYFHKLYFDWCKPLILSVEKAAKVNKLVLWENFFIYIRWFYLTLAPKLSDLDQQNWEDELSRWTGKTFFGIHETNPFYHLNEFKAKRLMEDGSRVRSTCCYKVQLPGGKNCKTCCQLKA
ncbi:hypothetical protein [Jeotgalibacillus aurantiacus]|uniref:hypothetical protein n=1 Tax=Jeotgalibacillus aurantiacus TaxID=2763266 RepID=UPI001D0B6BEA|nr:hypothetical protein [Jeotgalibacillus aurantiacus]